MSLIGCQSKAVEPQANELDIIRKSLIQQVNGQKKLNFNRLPIFEFIDEFYASDMDRTIEQSVKIYKIGNFCVATTQYENESGFGGVEDVVVFANNKFKYGFEREIYQIYKEIDDSINLEFTGKFRYDADISNDTIVIEELIQSLNRWYKNNFTEDIKNACYSQYVAEEEILDNKKISDFYGHYKFDNYETDERLGTGVGVFYDINLSKNSCKIDIVGYQTDNHFLCYIKPLNNNKIEVYTSENDEKFSTIQKMDDNKFKIDVSYYLENGSDSYIMEKVK